MYNTGSNIVTSGHSGSFNDSPETKQTVAELLSSLSGSEYTPAPPAYSGISTASYNTLTGTTQAISTPILTPNTLVTLEQAFSQIQQVQPSYTSGTQAQQITRESGFVPPVVSQPVMVKQEYSDYSYQDSFGDDSSDGDWMPPTAKRSRMGTPPAAHSHHGQHQGQGFDLQPAHNMTYTASIGAPSTARRTPGPRRHLKNEMLPPEEEEKRGMRRERNKVAAAKCRQRRVDLTNTLLEESEGLEDERGVLETEIQSLQHQKEQLEFLLEAHKPVCSNHSRIGTTPSTSGVDVFPGTVAIKVEPSTTISSRPNSLPLRTSVSLHATASIGVPVTTPSNGMNVFSVLGLDSLMDGHTGLTPLTGTGHTGLTPLTSTPSCSSQVHRNSDSSPNDTLASPTTLMAL